MPFLSVPCHIWLPQASEKDAWGNVAYTYSEDPDIVTTCCYAPGERRPETSDDIEQGRPHGTTARVAFFLPKSLHADLRGARIAAYQTDDAWMEGRTFDVEGAPTSYMRGNTPGDYSWWVEGVEHRG
jgi:hypothetical protein